MFGYLKLQTKPKITFRCAPRDLGVIAEPVPAKTVLPGWFKKLPAVDKEDLSPTDRAITVKRCMPFLDAMTTGWIIPLAATVRMKISDDGKTQDSGWEFDRVMVSNHSMSQVRGNPREPRPPSKFHNYWTIETPPGWSCLFVAPLNRANNVVEIMSGIVDTDSYQSLIHFPFFATAPDGLYRLERGMPLVQVIPFRRETSHIPADVRAETVEEAKMDERIRRQTDAADGWYRTSARAPR